MKGRNKISPDFGSCAMTAHPRQPVFILPEKVSASSDTTDVSPDMAARHHDTNNNNRNGILSLLLSVIMLVKPSLASAQANQPQGPVKEPQKIEQSAVDQSKLNQELMNSIMRGNVKRVEELVSQGADCNVNYHGFIPLNFAIQRGHKDVAIFLIKHGALVNLKDNKGRTPLSCIIEAKPDEWSKYSDITQLLLDNGADVVAVDRQGLTLAHKAAAKGQKDLLLLLLKHGASVDSKDNNGRTLLHFAAGASVPGPDVVQLLLDKGLDVNAEDNQGTTPLHQAAAAGNKDIVLFLLKHGAPVDAKDNNGRALLHFAAGASVPNMKSRSNPELVQLFLDKGLDVNAEDNQGTTPLHQAAAAGNKDIVLFLLKHGAPVDAKDNAGRTPLHYAAGASRGSGFSSAEPDDCIQVLLDNDADINAQDKLGWTPLHYAARSVNLLTIRFLLSKGAICNLVDNRGYTPYLYVRDRGAYFRDISPYATTHLPEWQKGVKTFEDAAEELRQGRTVYFVATDGKDHNSGTLEYPFGTIDAAIDIVGPGDIIFIRGGEYHCSRTVLLSQSGEQDKPICLSAYSEEIPVLNFSQARGNSIHITGAHWRIKGLVITKGFRGAISMYGKGAHHNILEQVTAYKNRHTGIRIEAGAAYNIILNCDSYKNVDEDMNGDASDGFSADWFIDRGNVFIGSRAWGNSDDGFDFWDALNGVRLERCYAFCNGVNIWNHPFFLGNGVGFKLGRGFGRHVLINCVAWGHPASGFDSNANTEGVILRNCTGWDNLFSNYCFIWGLNSKDNVLRNNLSHGGRDSIKESVDNQFNSWDSGPDLVLTDDDFISLDDSMMSAPRNPDGSIPQNNFLKLAPGSAAIDKGIDIGMPFAGERPDLGAFEHDPNAPSQGYVKMLHQYVRDRDIKRIKELLAQGEGINEKDWLGYTPIQWAVYFGYPEVVELLLSQGADPDIQSDTGRYALEIAKAMAYTDIEALLRKHEAKQ